MGRNQEAAGSHGPQRTWFTERTLHRGCSIPISVRTVILLTQGQPVPPWSPRHLNLPLEPHPTSCPLLPAPLAPLYLRFTMHRSGCPATMPVSPGPSSSHLPSSQ